MKRESDKFLDNAEHKLLSRRMPEKVYEGNNKQFLWKNTEQFYLMQKTDFKNAITKFKYTVNIMCIYKVLLM